MICQITMGQISDFLHLVVIACVFAYACREIYKLGYYDGKEAKR